MNTINLLIDSCRGIYIPQHFATSFDLSQWKGIDKEAVEILSDVDNEFYWEAWDSVLSNATFEKDGNVWRLYQDGDLWAICYELMTDEEKHNFGMED